MTSKSVSVKQLSRYPVYLKLFKQLKEQGVEDTSAPQIAKVLGFTEEQVRKDLQLVSTIDGKPGCGRKVINLIDDIENFLGYRDSTLAVVVGVGHLGGALMAFRGFHEFGLDILAGFDPNPKLIGSTINGKPIFGIDKLENLIPRLNVHIAILVTPQDCAQEMADELVRCGIKAIWNFVPMHINVPDGIIVENENLASSLAVLSHKLKKKLGGK